MRGRALRPAHLDPESLEQGEQLGQDRDRAAVDEREVEPVADAEPVEARLGHREHLLRRGAVVDVEDAAALGVRERADAVLRRVPRERSGRRPAPAQDHERDQLGQRDEHSGSLAVGRAHEADGRRRQGRSLERGAENVVDEHGHGPERGAARAEDGGVEALQELAGDVERHVRARLEGRADDADRDRAAR